MEGQKTKLTKIVKTNISPIVIFSQYFIFITGAINHTNPTFSELVIKLTFIVLLVFCGINLYLFSKINDFNRKVLIWIIGGYLFTFILEAIGTATGLIFGSYTYGEVLGPKIASTPIIIGLNWLLVILGAYELVGRKIKSELARAIIAAALTVAFDFIMEPVAIKLGYWGWESGEIPLQNYLAWFGISLILIAVLQKLKLKVTTKTLGHLFLAQAIFFFLLSIL